MTGPQARSVLAMEVLVEKKVISPVDVGLELLNISVTLGAALSCRGGFRLLKFHSKAGIWPLG